MKKLITSVLFLSAISLFAQNNITNTLGTGGSFFVKDATTTFLTLLQSNGNVGIGTTAPACKLDISSGDNYGMRIGPNTTFGRSLLLGGWNNTDFSEARIQGSNGNLHLDAKSGNDIYINNYHTGNVLIAGGGGYVGIGTTSPSQRLEVDGNILADAFKVDDNGYFQTQIISGSTNDVVFGFDANDYMCYEREENFLFFNVGGAHSMRITSSGNVGIGTTTPTSKLQVVGIPEYADNAAAKAGGLTDGAFYHTDGVLKVVYTP